MAASSLKRMRSAQGAGARDGPIVGGGIHGSLSQLLAAVRSNRFEPREAAKDSGASPTRAMPIGVPSPQRVASPQRGPGKWSGPVEDLFAELPGALPSTSKAAGGCTSARRRAVGMASVGTPGMPTSSSSSSSSSSSTSFNSAGGANSSRSINSSPGDLLGSGDVIADSVESMGQRPTRRVGTAGVKREASPHGGTDQRQAASDTAQQLLSIARKESLSGIIPAAQFLAGARADGRPCRRRIPPLEHWRNEHIVYERERGSMIPTVRAVKVAGSVQALASVGRGVASFVAGTVGVAVAAATAAASPAAPALRERRRGRLARVYLPTEQASKSSADVAVIVDDDDLGDTDAQIAQPSAHTPRHVEAAALAPRRRVGVQDEAPIPVHARAVQRPVSAPHVGVGRGAGLKRERQGGKQHLQAREEQPEETGEEDNEEALAEEVKEEQEEQEEKEEEKGEEEVEEVPKPLEPPKPLRSALRKRNKSGDAPPRITFSNSNTTTAIENITRFANDLWYPGFMVECDRCDQRVQWGIEGSIMGAPGRSRFAQDQVLCNCCLSDKLYAEIGAWVVVALAAGPAEGSGGVANAPVTSLLTSLIHLGSRGGASKGDLLISLLGAEAEDREVRTAVLRKARSHVGGLLGGPSVKEEPADEEAGEELEESTAEVDREVCDEEGADKLDDADASEPLGSPSNTSLQPPTNVAAAAATRPARGKAEASAATDVKTGKSSAGGSRSNPKAGKAGGSEHGSVPVLPRAKRQRLSK
mmetsp:Transcript_58013/g.166347  ORF Transcript_58013/g.166347 Transcript_58013/m.166347 type:complete len:759 (-) Transcript_58013:161-2437(-)